jgi:tetratricopeptide (TPR) repeat protein
MEGGTGAVAAGPGSIPSPPVESARPPLLREYLVPALRHLLRSRDACPLRAEAHMEIAERLEEFAEAEPREAYLERAKFLAPDDPGLWERCGILEIRDGRPDQAWLSWRHAIELSESRLPQILARCTGRLSPLDILGRVVPDRPEVLLKAAQELYPQPGEGRRPFLERALALLEKRPPPPAPADLHLKGSIHRALGQPDEAVVAYRAALDRQPLELDWRYDLAEVLLERADSRNPPRS